MEILLTLMIIGITLTMLRLAMNWFECPEDDIDEKV